MVSSSATPVQYTARPPRPGSGYFWNGVIGQWLYNPAAAPKVAKLHQHPDSGIIHALSSDGSTRYVVRLGDAASCTCRGFTSYGHCYHLTTALQRFPAFYTSPYAVLVPDPEPEPPPPAAAAVRHTVNCLLYTDDHCPACRRAA